MILSIFNFKRPAAVAAVLLFFGCFGVSAMVLKGLFDRPNFQSMAVEALGPGTETLVVGSSRVFFGVEPSRYGTGLMNLAADYLDLSTAEELWQLHRVRVPHLKELVLEFGLATLRYDTRTLEPYACYHLGLTGRPPFQMFQEDFNAAVHRWLSVFFKWRLTPLYWHLQQEMRASTLEPLAAEAGFIPTGVEYQASPRLVQRRLEKTAQQLAAQSPAVYDRNLKSAKNVIASANATGVNVVLLRFPKSPDVRRLYLAEWDQVVAAAIASLRDDPRNLQFTVVDLSRDERFVAADFRDPDHLNRRGAGHLAELLRPRLGL